MDESDITYKVGKLRELNSLEREEYPGFIWVTESIFELWYGDGYYIKIPTGFLSDGSTGTPDYGTWWLFHDYLYATHEFTSGQECTREMADNIFELLAKYNRAKCAACCANCIFWCNPCKRVSNAWDESGKGAQFIKKVRNYGTLSPSTSHSSSS